jgi:hypothetical protein
MDQHGQVQARSGEEKALEYCYLMAPLIAAVLGKIAIPIMNALLGGLIAGVRLRRHARLFVLIAAIPVVEVDRDRLFNQGNGFKRAC